MAQSPEYPDLRWVPPASWTDANRSSVQLIVIHTTEGSEGPTSAEDGATYDQRRTDGTSCHFFHDQDSTVQCVRTADIAHAARRQGNLRGIQHELCGRAGQTPAQWDDPASLGTQRQAAKQCARDARRWGIPVRHLTVAQVADGAKGFCGHWDITRAFPQDQGTHTDPGPNFPWTDFLDLVRAEMGDDMDATQTTAWATSADGKAALSAAARDAVMGVLWDGYAAATGQASADTDTDRAKRNVRDTLRAIVGGPVDQGAILAAVAGVDEAVWSKVPDPAVTVEEKAALLRAVLGDQATAVGTRLAQPA